MPTFLATNLAHLIDSFTGGESAFLVHITPSSIKRPALIFAARAAHPVDAREKD
ncbi:MAG TPA: hypothetical protein VJW17_12920 [Pyrinomonadaceae bacterium]|nr:hypothetical protein [Pyrinomonadaceae bacterium]